MRELLDLVYPRVCVGCGSDGSDVCPRCLAALEPGLRPTLPYLEQIRYCGRYQGWLRDAVLAYKAGDESMVRPLARVLGTALPAGSRVTPVPSSSSKVRRRGFDTVTGIVECATVQRLAVLRVVGRPLDQVGLSAVDRQRNVQGAFRSGSLVAGEIWLVDDVVTTGATLSAAAHALCLAGGGPIRAVALCSAQR